MARPRNAEKDAAFIAMLFGWAFYSRHKVTGAGTSRERYKAFDLSASEIRKYGRIPEQIWRKTFCLLVQGGIHKNEDGTTSSHVCKWILNTEAADFIAEMYASGNKSISELMDGLSNMRQLEWREGMINIIHGVKLISHDKSGKIFVKRQKKRFYTVDEYKKIKAHNKKMIDGYKKSHGLH